MSIRNLPGRTLRASEEQGRPRYYGFYIGFVKRVDDATRMGRIAVWVPEIGGDPEKEESWIVCSYLSPFAGASSIRNNKVSDKWEDSQTSYGFWMVPPDLENEVGVMFANGDPARAFWVGGAYQQNMNHMIPGVAVGRTQDGNWAQGSVGSASDQTMQDSPRGRAASAANYNVGYYRTLEEAQAGAARYKSAADYARANPQNYTEAERQAAFRLEAAANAEVARLSGASATNVETARAITPPTNSQTGGGQAVPAPTASTASTASTAQTTAPASTPAPAVSSSLPFTSGRSGNYSVDVARGPRAQAAMQFFVNRGWTEAQAAGIVGNIVQESGFKTEAYNERENAQGIVQWRNDRLARFEQRYGTSMRSASLAQQLDYVDWELKNTERNAGNRLRATTDVASAARVVDQFYERSAGTEREARVRWATESANTFRPGSVDASALDATGRPTNTNPTITQAQADRVSNGANGGSVAPVVEYNKLDDKVDPNEPRRPVFKPLAEALIRQGLENDTERGQSSTSARRESPSKVFGFLTPRANTIHVDDNQDNEFIRLRTRQGAQILIHQSTGYIYMITKGGNAWMELSDSGIDVYSANSISMRAEKNFNIRADQNIFFDAGNKISLRAGDGVYIESGKGFTLRAEQSMQMKIGGSLKLAIDGDHLTNVTGKLAVQAGGNITLKTGAAMAVTASGNISTGAGGDHIRSAGGNLLDNTGEAPTAPDVAAVNPGVPAARRQSDVERTTVTRMPTHEPWSGHPKNESVMNSVDPASANGGQTVPTGTGSAVTSAPGQNAQACSAGVARTARISDNVYNSIREASEVSGVDQAYLLAMGQIESGFRNVKAGTSSAGGIFQFIDSTWASMVRQYGRQYNIGIGDKYDERANSIMGGLYARDNANALRRAGVEVNNGNLYLAHFLGSGGAIRVLRSPDAPIQTLVNGNAISANANVFRNVSTGRDLMNWAGNKVNPLANAWATQRGLPSPCSRAPDSASTDTGTPNLDRTGGGALPLPPPLPPPPPAPIPAPIPQPPVVAPPPPAPSSGPPLPPPPVIVPPPPPPPE